MCVPPHLLNDSFYSFNQGLDNGVRGYWSFEVNTRECPRTIWDRVCQGPFSHPGIELTLSLIQLGNIFK